MRFSRIKMEIIFDTYIENKLKLACHVIKYLDII